MLFVYFLVKTSQFQATVATSSAQTHFNEPALSDAVPSNATAMEFATTGNVYALLVIQGSRAHR